jgi:hypothetical protein
MNVPAPAVPVPLWKSRGFAPALAVVLVLVWFAGMMFSRIGEGTLQHSDELLTAERGREVRLTGDPWTIHYNFAPSFHKPPLHYYLVALAQWAVADIEFAARFWTVIFTLLCALGTALLTRCLAPDARWAPVWALLFFCSSGVVIVSGRMAFLDPGMAAFILATIGGAILARRDSRAWYLVGLAVALEACYKTPASAAVWALILLVRLLDPVERARLPSRHLWVALAIGVAGLAAWPALASWQHGRQYWDIFLIGGGTAQGEIDELLSGPVDEVEGKLGYLALCLHFWHPIGLAAVLAALVCLFRPPVVQRRVVWETALIALTYLLAILLIGKVRDRYTFPLHPLLSALLSVALCSLPPRRAVWGVGAALVLLGWGAPAAWKRLKRHPKSAGDVEAIVRSFQQAAQPQETLVFVYVPRSGLRMSQVLLYGDLRRPLLYLEPATVVSRLRGTAGPLRGVCSEEAWGTVAAAVPAARVVEKRAQFVHWQAPG